MSRLGRMAFVLHLMVLFPLGMVFPTVMMVWMYISAAFMAVSFAVVLVLMLAWAWKGDDIYG